MSAGSLARTRMRLALRSWLVLSTIWHAGCADAPTRAQHHAVAADGGKHESLRPQLCEREVATTDPVREVFCADTPPSIHSLQDLKQLLTSAALGQPAPSQYAFTLFLGHSTSLSGRLVSSINPRAISILSANGGPDLAFTRGVQQVELVAIGPDRTTRRFYLLRFTQACNARPEGCGHGDLYTPQIEQDWLKIELLDDEELKNTPQDCKLCHQRARETPQLLMREIAAPWMHFFEPVSQAPGLRNLPGMVNSDLARDYIAAKGDESYAGQTAQGLPPSGAGLLAAAAGMDQPLLFATQEILRERWPRDADGTFPSEPHDSKLWLDAYAAFKRGDQLALPYYEQRATDPDKLSARSEAYSAYRAGEMEASELPDLADVFPDDPLQRAHIGLQTEPDASATDTLIQACGACHNDVLDQSLSRAHFNIDVSRMDASELDRAIDRIQRKADEGGVMPPTEARQLDSGGRERLIDFLRGAARSGKPIPELQHAAQQGMAGGTTFDGQTTTFR